MNELKVISPETLKAAAEQANKFPTEIVTLPSKGLLYPDGHPLRSGEVEIKYMTAKEEDILSTKSYIEKGVVLDKLLQSLIVTDFDYDTLLIGDRNAIMIAARIYGYGPEYKTQIKRPNGKLLDITVDLKDIPNKEFDESLITPGKNQFICTLPVSKKVVELELFTVGKFKDYEASIAGLEKTKAFNKGADQTATTLYRYLIKSIDGVDQNNLVPTINQLIVADTRFLRDFIAKVQPDIDLDLEMEDPDTGETFRNKIQLGISLFYPDFEK